MPKIKDRSGLTKRQQRRLVESEYKELQRSTQVDDFVSHELSLSADSETSCIIAEPNSAAPTSIAERDSAIPVAIDEPDSIVAPELVELDNTISEITSPWDDFCGSCIEDSDSSSDNSSLTDHGTSFRDINERNFQTDLRNWAIIRNISHADLNALLKVLHSNGFDVPLDSRTLIKTPSGNMDIIEMTPGHYHHFGLRSGLSDSISAHFSAETCPLELKINVNVDGLPLTKSTGSQFWPILVSIDADFQTEPFVVGIYHGHTKPSDSNEFLKYFVDEFQNISTSGITMYNKTIHITVNAFICDAPAKSYITGTKGHNAYFGCGKCIQEGEFVQNRVTYPEVDARLRTDESFRQKTNEEHHRKSSILERLLICMILTFPLDYMHLVCLGVMKRLLQLWVKGKKDVRMSNPNLIRASNHLVSLSGSISKEFCRKPRPLGDVDRFKATELRQLLLYTGPIIFKDTLTSDQYRHFLSLSIAIRILASPELHLQFNGYARSLLVYFVTTFPLLYGHQHVSYNVHNLVHLCDDVLSKGPLDKFSVFKFENHMQEIKKKLRTSGKPLQQFIKRHEEQRKLNSEICITPNKKEYPIIKYDTVVHAGQKRAIKSLEYAEYFVSTRSPNNCFCLKDGTVVVVNQIYSQNEKIHLVGKTFCNSESLFTIPCASAKFGIKVVSNRSSLSLQFGISHIKSKCLKFMSLPHDSEIIIPLLHH